MRLEFKKAERRKSKLRLFIFGLSGSGKTYISLKIASQLGKKIAVADTEVGHAQFFADKEGFPEFHVLELPDNRIETFLACIEKAVAARFDVLIIDSITHEWDYIKELAEKGATVTKSGKKDNRSGWGTASPVHKKFLDALMKSPLHIITTARAKPEWDQQEYYDKSGNRKTKSVRVRGAPEQKAGLEADFTMSIIMDSEKDEETNKKNYFATILRDRTTTFEEDSIIQNPGDDFIGKIAESLNKGQDFQKKDNEKLATQEQLNRFDGLCSTLKLNPEKIKEKIESKGFSSKESVNADTMDVFIDSLEEALKKVTDAKTLQQSSVSQDVL